eukprot:4843370-Alexandrium_andersonii.AAC.1
MAGTAREMERIKCIWARLERATSLKNNASKQKDWSYTLATGVRKGTAPAVLGVGLPSPARAAIDKERGKTQGAAHQLRRIGSLPLNARL